MALYVLDRLVAYLKPLVFIAIASYAALLVLLEVVTFQRQPKDLLSPRTFCDRIFGKVWLRIDKSIAAAEQESNVPNLIAKASGTVLELGSGSGNQLPRYSISKVDRIYGVEPNLDLHDALRSNIKKHGLNDVFTIVPCGVEDVEKLGEYGIVSESIDTITSVQVLCSVPEPAALIKDLYRLLKPGGQMIVFEHVKSDDYLSQMVQLAYNLVWPYAMGNCHLDRHTEKYLLEAGSWSTIELETPREEDAWQLLPRVSGRLVKWGSGAN